MKVQRLKKLFDARHPCIRLVTHEETEVVHLALDSAAASRGDLERWIWSATGGLRRATFAEEPSIEGTENPAAALVYLRRNLRSPAVCIFVDLVDHFGEPRVVRGVRDLVEYFRHGGHQQELARGAYLVLIDHKDDVPPVIESCSVRHDITLPDEEELEEIAKRTLRRFNQLAQIDIDIPRRAWEAIIGNLKGLQRREAERIMVELVADDRKLTADDVPRAIEAKRRLLQGAGVLEFVNKPASLDEIGGLRRLKQWLKQRERAFLRTEGDAALPPPRGVLLLGVQGAGKSLSAKAIATAWQRPLMRLDPGALYDRYIGESERKLREALAQAEAMAPVVLWVDEIEKGFASAASRSTDGGLSQRMFGTLLWWMQEHTAPVFLVATANDIEALPPELLRKGRFDEIFFVDLPGHEARAQIFKVHLKRHKQDPRQFDLQALIHASNGFSGAEIEQAVISGMHEASAASTTLTTHHVLSALEQSPPLSVTMAERIADLRAWAQGRCVPAD